jgi:hypothetical protein
MRGLDFLLGSRRGEEGGNRNFGGLNENEERQTVFLARGLEWYKVVFSEKFDAEELGMYRDELVTYCVPGGNLMKSPNKG